MKKAFVNKKNLLFVFCTLVLLSSLLSVLVHAAGTEVCTDPATRSDCYQDNPTYANIVLIAEPTQEQFDLLLAANSQEAALYLVSHYDTDFASSYISQTNLASVDAIGAHVAERYFSEDADNVQEHKTEFQQYLYSKGVSISLVGDITAYKQDGTIVADNGQINVKDFGGKYSFVVNDADELVLVPKGSTKEYTFEGIVIQNGNGELQIKGEGSFDGLEVENAAYIKIGKAGNTLIGAEQYGDLHCQTVCHMVYNPKDKTYQLKDAVLADYPDFKVTGTLRLDEAYYGLSTTYTIPAGKKLEVQPIISDPARQEIADQGYRVLANGGKDVQIALEDDTWLDHPADFVLQYIGETAVSVGLVSEETVTSATESFEESYQEAVEAGIAPETKKDKVRLDSEGTVYMESTDAAGDEAASYRMEVDMGAMYTAELQKTQVAEYIAVPEKGFYEAGDFAKAGTEDYEAIEQIQTIVGAKADGKYGKKTGQAVSNWENEYNQEFGLTPEMTEYLDPDGLWDERNTYAYLRMTKQLEETPALAMDMRGGEAAIDLSSGGFDIVQTGAMDIEVEGVVFKYDAAGNTDKELQQLVKNDISIPITITSCTGASSSADVAGSAIEPVTGANCYKYSSTEASYGLGSLSEGFANGNVAASCPLFLGMYDVSSASCASHVSALAQIEGGRYQTYGSDKDTFMEYTGQLGNAWEMSSHVRDAGGKTLYWKEANGAVPVRDPTLSAAVSYDQANLKEGDNLGLYYQKSGYLEEAAAQGLDGRKNTHVAKVVAKKHEAYTYHDGEPQPAAVYIQEQLDVTPTYLSGYPVWINSEKAVYKDGNFYYADAQGTPQGSPITLQSGDRVDVEKTLISHLYHDPEDPSAMPTRLDDYGWFLSNYPDFSLYEHYRPSEQKYTEADQKKSGSVAVEIHSNDDLVAAFASQGIPQSQVYTALAYTKEINGIPQEGGFQTGDVIMIPSAAEFQERYSSSLQEQLEENDIANSNVIITAAEASTKERVKEYNIPDSEVSDLMEATITIGYYQKGFIPEEDWELHPLRDFDAPDGWRDSYANEFAEEQYAAWLDQETGIVPDRVSYGYLDTQSITAQQNAEELADAGVIDGVDYTGPEDMLTYEGSFTHGGREIAKLWGRYTEPDMSYEEKLALVGFGYNRGEDAPMLLAVQDQFTELGYTIEEENGMYNEQTLTVMETFANDNNIPFDREEVEEQIEERTFDFEETPVYVAMKEQYKAKTGKEPVYARPPVNDGYVYWLDDGGQYWDLMDTCEIITPVKGRCAVQTEGS